jgi:gas vesicle structural protein
MAVSRTAPLLSTADVLDRVLDKGIVIDAEIHIAVCGIELLTITAFVRIASFETWDRYVASEERRARTRTRRARPAADAAETHRVRLRCEDGCTFARRASALVIRDGRLGRQRCVADARRECAVAVV